MGSRQQVLLGWQLNHEVDTNEHTEPLMLTAKAAISLIILWGESSHNDKLGPTCTCGGIHQGRVELASPRRGDVSWVGGHAKVPNPGMAAFIGLAAQARLVRFMNAGVSALHTLPFVSNPGDATGTQGIGVVMTTPPFVGPFGMSVGAQSTAQSWHTDPYRHPA